MKIGDEVFIHGYVDEIRQDTVIIRNDGGYFGTVPSEVTERDENGKEKWLEKETTENIFRAFEDLPKIEVVRCKNGER